MSMPDRQLEPADEAIQMLDAVVLTEPLLAEGLAAGHLGTVVEILDEQTFEVEFADLQGRTYAMVPVAGNKLLKVRHGLRQAS